jgi:hypothetical protein
LRLDGVDFGDDASLLSVYIGSVQLHCSIYNLSSLQYTGQFYTGPLEGSNGVVTVGIQTLTCRVPQGEGGPLNVTLCSGGACSGGLPFSYDAPIVYDISPKSFPTCGRWDCNDPSTSVVITATGLNFGFRFPWVEFLAGDNSSTTAYPSTPSTSMLSRNHTHLTFLAPPASQRRCQLCFSW